VAAEAAMATRSKAVRRGMVGKCMVGLSDSEEDARVTMPCFVTCHQMTSYHAKKRLAWVSVQ